MADWKAQYLNNLRARDEAEQAAADIYEKCKHASTMCPEHRADKVDSQLADRTAAVKAELRKVKAEATPSEAAPSTPVPPPLISYGFRRQTSPLPAADTSAVVQLRQDFATAQQERADLQSRVDTLQRDLDAAQSKGRQNEDQISKLTGNVSRLTIKLKDKEEELKGKARLLQNVQDENATLNLELDQAEQDVKKVKLENEELVDRWVARMAKEADKMNEDSQFT